MRKQEENYVTSLLLPIWEAEIWKKKGSEKKKTIIWKSSWHKDVFIEISVKPGKFLRLAPKTWLTSFVHLPKWHGKLLITNQARPEGGRMCPYIFPNSILLPPNVK